MRFLFTSVLYGFSNSFIRSNLAYLKSLSFLKAAANYIGIFEIMQRQEPLRALAAEQRPLLNVLEECIHSVDISFRLRLSEESRIVFYILHRLLDHGVAKGISIHGVCPLLLAWILHGRGSRFTYAELGDLAERWKPRGRGGGFYQGEDAPPKRLKLADRGELDLDPQALCGMFSACDGVSSSLPPCGRGNIECLEIIECGVDCLQVLCVALPTFSVLRTLTVSTLREFVTSSKRQRLHFHDSISQNKCIICKILVKCNLAVVSKEWHKAHQTYLHLMTMLWMQSPKTITKGCCFTLRAPSGS